MASIATEIFDDAVSGTCFLVFEIPYDECIRERVHSIQQLHLTEHIQKSSAGSKIEHRSSRPHRCKWENSHPPESV